ncbi:MAG: acyl-CoA dehydrogenase family protein [Bacteroidota bacterium]|nr:acyl-CoA dehydrogenase family protein [Bacteroidota bacterium]
MSKGGSFLIEETDPNSIFIAEEWNEEQVMLKEMVHDFLTTELHHLPSEPDASKDLQFISGLLEKSAELGLCGLGIKKEYGGLDLDFNTGLLFSEAVAPGFSFATTIGAQTSIGSLPIVYYGTKEQKEKYLPKIATAEYKASYALTEPESGSDANSGKTKATFTEKGDYLINGQKMWITNGGFADIFIVFAKIEDDDNLSAFIVEKTFGGITLGEEEKKLGIKGSSTVQVFFNDCPVPKDNLLGDRQGGFKIALNILNSGRIKLAASTNGGSKYALSKGIQYAIERKQFDKSIAEFTAMQFKIGEMARLIFSSESALYRTGKNIDLKEQELIKNGSPENETKINALREYAIECAILKVYCSETLDYCVDETLQIYGGMGYSVEAGVEMGYRDARITRIYEGTNEINRMLTFAELMKRAFKSKELDLVKAGKKIPLKLIKSLLPFQNPTICKRIEMFKDLFLILSGHTGKLLGLKLAEEQEIVMDLADILSEIFIIESVYLRVQKLTNQKSSSKELSIKKDILDLQLYMCTNTIREKSMTIIDSLASNKNKRFLKLFSKRLTQSLDINPTFKRRKIAKYFIEKGEYSW